MQLDILTPEKRLFAGEVHGVQLPGIDGLFELLDRHAPLVSALSDGDIKIIDTNKADGQKFAISGGFVEMLNNRATVLVEKVFD